MIRRAIDLVLIAAIAVGGVQAWRTDRERARLQRELDRLSLKAGDLRIDDPKRIHVCAIETGDPLHFAWHIYLPAKYRCEVHQGAGGSRGISFESTSSQPKEFIARVRFLENKEGNLDVYARFSSGSRRTSYGDPHLSKFVRDHRGDIRVEQLGRPDSVSLATDRPAMLLRLIVPEGSKGEVRDLFPYQDQNKPEVREPVLFWLEFGPPTPGR